MDDTIVDSRNLILTISSSKSPFFELDATEKSLFMKRIFVHKCSFFIVIELINHILRIAFFKIVHSQIFQIFSCSENFLAFFTFKYSTQNELFYVSIFQFLMNYSIYELLVIPKQFHKEPSVICQCDVLPYNININEYFVII